ncbi:MAG: ATP-binding cassette domain-containing protein [Desulfobacterium sp.]|jgi:phospholipid/cholesterol/gamma-HCH transport system ATP-binding protein|nr:ATP-binding cassette domain-containing protein [Desulfobacterium sp.]
MVKPFIEFKDVRKSFGSNHVMRGVNLSIYEGEITVVIGKSGCGKSVLLKHIIGLEAQDSGSIIMGGEELSAMDRHSIRRFRNKTSYMFQDNALFDSLNVFENIALPLTEGLALSRRETRERVLARMEQLEISGIEGRYPAELSGGMKKRVALARALVTEPDVVLFDEPTTGLDPVRKNAVHGMIQEYQQRFGFTAVVVSHEIPGIFKIAQRVAMIDRGKIIFQGSPDEILGSNLEEVSSFINGRGVDEEWTSKG